MFRTAPYYMALGLIIISAYLIGRAMGVWG